MEKTARRLVLMVLVALGVLAPMSASAKEPAPMPNVPMPLFAQSNCWGEGCTHLNATRSGNQVTVRAHGFSYVPGRRVHVQISISIAATGALLYRDRTLYTVKSDGRTPVKLAFADCGPTVLIQAWTWKYGSNYQPGVSVYL